MLPAACSVRVQRDDFDIADLQRSVLQDDAGAVVAFTGYVKAGPEATVTAIDLEHYPGMTEKSIAAIVQEAQQRWSLKSIAVVHRVGRLAVGEQIVWVGASATHRGDAFEGCEFIMDYLKTRAPFWKRELGSFGRRWVEARASDQSRAQRWHKN
ncbi:molybdopterin synthase catalytic subunit MoaE [Sediminihaliea albiluteola]|uniref:molybdopterin synthase catalytic subunit MoaE n=1 Tax=Sediminihaliea albiluteola TaxID=2758564 RepID=UPI001F4521D8|nr:molybdopterin synthase catalytic subunit MoaE [Sediminihaliea albiluteola]